MIKEMNTYLANLAVLNYKLHNLHWNVVGLEFKAIHEHTEELYNKVFTDFDDVAEMLKIRNLQPAASLKEYLSLATLTELPSDVLYTPQEVIKHLKDDLTALKEDASKLRNLADEAGDFTAVSFFEDQVAAFAKELWFLSAMTK